MKKNAEFRQRQIPISENLNILRPSGMFRFPKTIELIDLLGCNSYSEKSQVAKYLRESQYVWLGSPIYYPIVEQIKQKIIYDKMDDYEFLTRNRWLKKIINRYEDKLIRSADTIFLSSSNLYRSEMKDKAFVVNNGIDSLALKIERDADLVLQIKDFKKKGKVVFGYIGTVDHWFDYNAIRTILMEDENNVVFIIGQDNIRSERIESSKVIYVDPIPKSDVFHVIKQFDFSLYPFKQGEYLETINPVKIYEYLACNQKIIAAESREVLNICSDITVYSNNVHLFRILQNKFEIKKPFLNSDYFIEMNSWNKRTEQIISILQR